MATKKQGKDKQTERIWASLKEQDATPSTPLNVKL